MFDHLGIGLPVNVERIPGIFCSLKPASKVLGKLPHSSAKNYLLSIWSQKTIMEFSKPQRVFARRKGPVICHVQDTIRKPFGLLRIPVASTKTTIFKTRKPNKIKTKQIFCLISPDYQKPFFKISSLKKRSGE